MLGAAEQWRTKYGGTVEVRRAKRGVEEQVVTCEKSRKEASLNFAGLYFWK